MSYSQIVLSIILPIIVALGGTIIGAVANRRLVKANVGDKVSSSYSKLVDDLQEENKKLRSAVQKLETNYGIHNVKLEELSRKYSKIIEENVTLRSQYAELKREYAGHKERSKARIESLTRITEVNTEVMESKINEYKQTIALQERRILVLEESMNGGLKT